MLQVKLNDKRYKCNKLVDIRTFEKNEKETTIIKTNDNILIYSSIGTDITKLLKIADNVEILTATENGTITSIKCTLSKEQVQFRNKLSNEQLEKKKIVGRKNLRIE